MAAHAVTVNLPMPLNERLARRATSTHHTVEAELVDTVATVLEEPGALSADMAEAMAALHLLEDTSPRVYPPPGILRRA